MVSNFKINHFQLKYLTFKGDFLLNRAGNETRLPENTNSSARWDESTSNANGNRSSNGLDDFSKFHGFHFQN